MFDLEPSSVTVAATGPVDNPKKDGTLRRTLLLNRPQKPIKNYSCWVFIVLKNVLGGPYMVASKHQAKFEGLGFRV